MNGRRTCLRLEPAVFDALDEICRRERVTLGALCSTVEDTMGGPDADNLSSALRVHALRYFRAAATEPGHAMAGHDAGVAEKGVATTTDTKSAHFGRARRSV